MSHSEDLKLWWKPSQDDVQGSNLYKFRKVLNAKYNVQLETYDDIHRFSVERLDDFWMSLWEWAGIRANKKPTHVLTQPAATAKPGDLPRFFNDAQVNLAENILFPLHPQNATACMPNAPRDWPPAKSNAIYEYGEALPAKQGAQLSNGPQHWRTVTWGELRRRVAVLSTALRAKGFQPGDRVAHVSANTSDPVVSFLACLAVGCIFSALPTDAGPQAIYGRLSQIRPRLVLTDDVAYYNGREINVIDRVASVVDDLVREKQAHEANGKVDLEVVCIVNQRQVSDRQSPRWKSEHIQCSTFARYLATVNLKPDSNPPLVFAPLPFNHPAIIVFSSGTTGEPKSICHSAGGILVNSKKEGLLQYERSNADTFLQITTCGWIMWLAQVGQLLSGTSIVTYDGSPLFPNALAIPQIISKSPAKVTAFGGSPRLLSEMAQLCRREGINHIQDQLPMPNLRLATCTGSPLNPANVQFFYEKFANKQTQLMSISGGTDLAGCLVGGSLMVPVRGHLICAKSLAMDVRIVDPVTGQDCEMTGEPGELVVAKPFPTQPLYFWGDEKDKDKLHEKYMDSYYRRFADGPAKGYWAQGDFMSRHLDTGSFEIHGRSDGVLNPSGVRFGSAEIYSVVESGKFPFVADSVVVGQRRPGKDEDERVLLFIKCRADQQGALTQARKDEIAQAIKSAYSARHVPAHIFEVRDIPVTANGKKTELAVKAVVSGNTAFKPSTATANPDALDEYRQYADIENVVATSRASKL